MASKPKLPTFADGAAYVEDLEAICDAIRQITPLPGGTVTPRMTPQGTYFMGGDAGGGELVRIVTATTIPAAAWTATTATDGVGSCRPYSKSGTVWAAGGIEMLRNPYPETAPANRFGWAYRESDGSLCLVTISCAAVPAAPTLPGNTTPGTGTSTGTTINATSGSVNLQAFGAGGWGWSTDGLDSGAGTATTTTTSTSMTLGMPTYVGKLPLVPTPP